MPSPFPGMNPLLEFPPSWSSLHAQLAVQLARALGPKIAPKYAALPQHTVQIQEDPVSIYESFDDDNDNEEAGGLKRPETHYHEADSAVTLQIGGGGYEGEDGGGTATLAPPAPPLTAAPTLETARLRVPTYYRAKHFFVNIVRADVEPAGREPVVTVIEILSPANKRKSSARRSYLAKRARVVRAGVSFVELDLLRAGRRTPLTGRPRSDYSVSVCKRGDVANVAVWAVGLRQRLPVIPVPLSPPDDDVPLDLQGVLNDVYDFGFYALRPGRPDSVAAIRPKLSAADAAWAREILESAAAARK